MSVTEFRERVSGIRARRVVGRLVVDEFSGAYAFSGGVPLEDLPILDRSAPSGRLWLRDDPARWAMRCHRIFCSGYVVAVRVDETAR